MTTNNFIIDQLVFYFFCEQNAPNRFPIMFRICILSCCVLPHVVFYLSHQPCFRLQKSFIVIFELWFTAWVVIFETIKYTFWPHSFSKCLRHNKNKTIMTNHDAILERLELKKTCIFPFIYEKNQYECFFRNNCFFPVELFLISIRMRVGIFSTSLNLNFPIKTKNYNF